MRTTKHMIRTRAEALGIPLGPALKRAGVIAWWQAVEEFGRADSEWQATEALIDWGDVDPAALFPNPPPSPAKRAVPEARLDQGALADESGPGRPEPVVPTMWQRARAWFAKKLPV